VIQLMEQLGAAVWRSDVLLYWRVAYILLMYWAFACLTFVEMPCLHRRIRIRADDIARLPGEIDPLLSKICCQSNG
jgi:hypothetical protein